MERSKRLYSDSHLSNIRFYHTIDAAEATLQEERAKQKRILLGILNPQPSDDPVLADPITKEAIILIPRTGTLFGSGRGCRTACRISYEMKAEGRSETYVVSSETFLNLLEPTDESEETLVDEDPETLQFKRQARIVRNLTPFIPPPLWSALAPAGVLVAEDYVPMRDLFTSPTGFYAYERGWRDSFQQAGFPGQDEEAEMAMEYFEPSMARSMDTRVLVDMSCATGLFTRRFAKAVTTKESWAVIIPLPCWRKRVDGFKPILRCVKVLKTARRDSIWSVWMSVKFPCKPTRSTVYTRVPPCIVGPIFLRRPPKCTES